MSTSIEVFVVTYKEDGIPLELIKATFEPYIEINSWVNIDSSDEDFDCALKYPTTTDSGYLNDEVWVYRCKTDVSKISGMCFFRPCLDMRSLDLIAQLLKISKLGFLWNGGEHFCIGNKETRPYILDELITAVGEPNFIESGADIYRECGFITAEQFKAIQQMQ